MKTEKVVTVNIVENECSRWACYVKLVMAEDRRSAGDCIGDGCRIAESRLCADSAPPTIRTLPTLWLTWSRPGHPRAAWTSAPDNVEGRASDACAGIARPRHGDAESVAAERTSLILIFPHLINPYNVDGGSRVAGKFGTIALVYELTTIKHVGKWGGRSYFHSIELQHSSSQVAFAELVPRQYRC